MSITSIDGDWSIFNRRKFSSPRPVTVPHSSNLGDDPSPVAVKFHPAFIGMRWAGWDLLLT